MRLKLKGIVICETPKGETSKLLTLLTDTHGVITVNAKGVRKLSSCYIKSAQLFAFSDFLLYEKNGFFTMTEASLVTDFYSIREDIKNYSLACYLCEAASAFAVSGEDSGKILRLLLNSLYAIENNLTTRTVIKAAFELRLCAESGFMPDVGFCTDCDCELKDKSFLFHPVEGMSFCTDCVNAGNEFILLPSAVGKAISHITESEMSKFLSFRINDNDQKMLSLCAERFLLSRAERGFKTLSFYKHCEELP